MARKQNPNIKKANTEVEFTPEQIEELRQCSTDPVYFIRNYVKIQHPVKGSVPFELYDYQEEMIRLYHQNRYSIVLASRQVGKSTVAIAFLLWYTVFNFDKTVLIVSNKNAGSIEMIGRIKYAYENLPFWLKPGIQDDTYSKHQIGWDNGSRIIAEATSENSGRGLSISLLYVDELAFVSPEIQEEFWTSISPTLATGGSCIVTSTPNGDSDLFSTLWRGSLVDVNGFANLHVPWDAPPDRDEEFKLEQIGKVGQRKWEQEYLCHFLSSDALLIDTLVLQQMTTAIQNIKPIKKVKRIHFWEEFKPQGTYLVGVDPATGSGKDFTVVEVFEFPSLRQVAEYRTNDMSPTDVYGVLKNLLIQLERLNTTVYFTIENNGVGQGLISLFMNDDNPPSNCEFVSEDKKDGMITTSRTKMRACINLKELVEKHNITIRSHILLSELKAFTRYKSAYAAQRGSTDDCVSSVLLITRLVEEISSYEQSAFDKLYAKNQDRWNEKDWDGFDEDYDSEDEGLPMIF